MSAKQNAIGRARQRLSRAVDLSCNGRESEARAKTREAMELLDSELYGDEDETEFEDIAWYRESEDAAEVVRRFNQSDSESEESR